jgi:hypothetical protein
MELESIMLSEVNQVQKVKVAYFLSYVKNRSNTNTSIIMYTYRYIQNKFPKAGLLEENRGRKKRRMIESE